MNGSAITNDYTSPSQGSKREHTVPPTAQPNRHFTQTKTAKHQDLLISVTIPVALILALLIIIAVYLYIRKARQTCSYLWCNCNTETGVADMENGASPTCIVHCKPTKRNLGRIAMFY